MLNGIDVMYDSIEEIVAMLSDDTITHVTTLAQSSQSRGIKLCREVRCQFHTLSTSWSAV